MLSCACQSACCDGDDGGGVAPPWPPAPAAPSRPRSPAGDAGPSASRASSRSLREGGVGLRARALQAHPDRSRSVVNGCRVRSARSIPNTPTRSPLDVAALGVGECRLVRHLAGVRRHAVEDERHAPPERRSRAAPAPGAAAARERPRVRSREPRCRGRVAASLRRGVVHHAEGVDRLPDVVLVDLEVRGRQVAHEPALACRGRRCPAARVAVCTPKTGGSPGAGGPSGAVRLAPAGRQERQQHAAGATRVPDSRLSVASSRSSFPARRAGGCMRLRGRRVRRRLRLLRGPGRAAGTPGARARRRPRARRAGRRARGRTGGRGSRGPASRPSRAPSPRARSRPGSSSARPSARRAAGTSGARPAACSARGSASAALPRWVSMSAICSSDG